MREKNRETLAVYWVKEREETGQEKNLGEDVGDGVTRGQYFRVNGEGGGGGSHKLRETPRKYLGK